MNLHRSATVAIVASLLAACASAPSSQPAAPAFDPAPMLAAIQQAGVSDSRELVVNPLADARTAGLHEDVAALYRQGRLAEMATLLDDALETLPDDPYLLQVRAESALQQGDLTAAESFARRAAAAGSQAGPNCRRHWETVVQAVAAQSLDGDALAAAKTSRDACTVAAPPRY